MLIHVPVFLLKAITSSRILSYLNHWTGFIDFLFYLRPNHCLFCVNQKRPGYTAIKKNTSFQWLITTKFISCSKCPTVWASLQSSCSPCGSSGSQVASISWHLLLHTVLQGPLCRGGELGVVSIWNSVHQPGSYSSHFNWHPFGYKLNSRKEREYSLQVPQRRSKWDMSSTYNTYYLIVTFI